VRAVAERNFDFDIGKSVKHAGKPGSRCGLNFVLNTFQSVEGIANGPRQYSNS
jgi:hypothetical protein